MMKGTALPSPLNGKSHGGLIVKVSQEVSDQKILAFDLATRGGADHRHQMLAASMAHLAYSGPPGAARALGFPGA
jgi:hypothetical protein